MGVKDHADRAEKEIASARCVVLTISDTRKAETDESRAGSTFWVGASSNRIGSRRSAGWSWTPAPAGWG